MFWKKRKEEISDDNLVKASRSQLLEAIHGLNDELSVMKNRLSESQSRIAELEKENSFLKREIALRDEILSNMDDRPFDIQTGLYTREYFQKNILLSLPPKHTIISITLTDEKHEELMFKIASRMKEFMQDHPVVRWSEDSIRLYISLPEHRMMTVRDQLLAVLNSGEKLTGFTFSIKSV